MKPGGIGSISGEDIELLGWDLVRVVIGIEVVDGEGGRGVGGSSAGTGWTSAMVSEIISSSRSEEGEAEEAVDIGGIGVEESEEEGSREHGRDTGELVIGVGTGGYDGLGEMNLS